MSIHDKIQDRAQELLKQYGSPCMVYDYDILKERTEQMLEGLSQIPTETRLYFACKANTNIQIMKLLREFGVYGIDTVSFQECQIALMCGFPAEKILYTAHFISNEEIQQAMESSILLNIGEISTIERIGQRYPGSKIVIRINPEIGSGECDHVITAGRATKFGIPVKDLHLVEDLVKKYDLKIVGLHQHIGSNIKDEDQDKYVDSVNCIFSLAGRFSQNLQFINIGGGIGVAYRKTDVPLSLKSVYKRVGELFEKIVKPQLPESQKIAILVEPGRYLVAESGQLLATVTSVKESFGNIYIGLDTGLNHLIRPAFYGSYHEIVNCTAKKEGRKEELEANIVGNICESSDVFAKGRLIKQTLSDDVIAIQNAGAYGYTMASNYNQRFRPPEILLQNTETRLIRKRETIQDIISTQLNL